MSKGTVNKVVLLGRLGQDPDMKSTAGGLAIANLSVATNHFSKDPQGNQNDQTEWHRCVVFGKTAELANQYLNKGSLVYLEGRLQTRKWQDQSGQDRYSTEIVCNEMQFIGGRAEGPQNNQNQQMQPQQQQNYPYQQPQQATKQSQGFDDFDDNISF